MPAPPELPEIQRDLETLTVDLKRLEAEYNMFFAGRLPRPPWETRGRVDALVKRWDGEYIEASVDRFRFHALQARYVAFTNLWDRALRAREEGRPGPFGRVPARAPAPAAESHGRQADERARVLHAAAIADPTRDRVKLRALYVSLMEARRSLGEPIVPFRSFADLVAAQIEKMRAKGSAEVAFRVTLREGKVGFTARGLKVDGP